MPGDDLDALTEDEVAWVTMQRAIDDGVQWCAHCEAFGVKTFCGTCGRRYVGTDLTWRECRCGLMVTTRWCPGCGYEVLTEFGRRLEAGEVDIVEENRKAAALLARSRISAAAAPASVADALNEVFGATG